MQHSENHQNYDQEVEIVHLIQFVFFILQSYQQIVVQLRLDQD
jgi:hypothetical protein